MNVDYVAHKDFPKSEMTMDPKKHVHIPRGAHLTHEGDILFWKNTIPVCFATSNTAHDFFSINNDLCGLLRGDLVESIRHALRRSQPFDVPDPDYDRRWEKVWASPLCQKYRKNTDTDFWYWSHEFFIAPIMVLRQIATLVEATPL